MNVEIGKKTASRVSPKEGKREARKQQLADSALEALREYGYANTTMRDIAKRSDLSLGMLHYYFENKEELLLFCVKRYKEGFVADIHGLTAAAETQEEVVQAIAGGLVLSLIREAETHRLWYDMRAQAMFDPTFRPMVATIEGALRDLFAPLANGDAQLLDRIYASADGQFRYFLQRLLSGEALSPGMMEQDFREVMTRLL